MRRLATAWPVLLLAVPVLLATSKTLRECKTPVLFHALPSAPA